MYYEISLKEETDAEKVFSRKKIHKFLDIKPRWNTLEYVLFHWNKLYLRGQNYLFFFQGFVGRVTLPSFGFLLSSS